MRILDLEAESLADREDRRLDLRCLGGLGLGLLVPRTAKVALVASLPWAVGVWYFGEGLSGLASGHTSLLTGAPGAVVLYGGEKVFAAGADVKDFAEMSHAEMLRDVERLSSSFKDASEYPCPVRQR